MRLWSFEKGMSVLEIVVASAIILILTTAFSGAWRVYMVTSRISNERTQAALLIDEASEAIQFLRDKSWATNISNLTSNTNYYLSWSGASYSLTTTPSVIRNFYIRKIVFSPILRDGQDNISSSGVTDIKTKKATITVTTNQSVPDINIQSEMLIHDIYNN